MKKIILLISLIITNTIFGQKKTLLDDELSFKGIIKYDNTKIYSSDNFDSTHIDTLYKNDKINVLGIIYNDSLDYNSFAFVKRDKLFGYILYGYFKNKDDFKKFKLLKQKKDSLSILNERIEKIKKDSISNLEKELLKNKYENDLKTICQFEINEIDEFNGVKNKITEYFDLIGFSSSVYRSGSDLDIKLIKQGKRKYIRFRSKKDLGCTVSYKGRKSSVKIKLNNGKIVSFYNFDDTDCGDFKMTANLTNSDIYNLKKSEIKTIRINGTKYYHDFKDIKWNTFFMDKLDCIN